MTEPLTLSRAKPEAKCVLIRDGDVIRPRYRAKLGREFVAHPDTQKHDFDTPEEAMDAARAFRDAVRESLKPKK